MYLHRTIEQSLPSLCQNFKVILISGMRKVGKRTLLQYLATNLNFSSNYPSNNHVSQMPSVKSDK